MRQRQPSMEWSVRKVLGNSTIGGIRTCERSQCCWSTAKSEMARFLTFAGQEDCTGNSADPNQEQTAAAGSGHGMPTMV